jgi:hypothetical protein
MRFGSEPFFFEKNAKKRPLRCARMCHRPRHIKKIKVFLLLFVHKKKCLLPSSDFPESTPNE